MKKILVTVAALASFVAMSYADGTLRLSSYESAKPVTINGAPAPMTENVVIQVLAGPVGGNLNPMTPFGATGPNFTLTSEGDFDAGYGVIPGIAGGTDQISVQVRAWVGADFATATLRGETAIWSQASGTLPPLPNAPLPADLAFPGLALTTVVGPVIPEPSTIALGLLGAALLLIRRRQ